MKKILHTSFILCCSFLILAQHSEASEFPALVQVNGKYGYQQIVEVEDEDGEIEEIEELVIPAIYITATTFNEETGLALVSADIAGDGWPYDHGYIDAEGNEVVPLLYQHLSDFTEGFALAQKDGKYGYLTPEGDVAVDFIYSEAAVFSGGKAVVKLDGEMMIIDRPNWVASSLGMQEFDYFMMSNTTELMNYFRGLLENGDSTLINDSDYVEIERFLSIYTSKMPVLNAEITEDAVIILGENYNSVLTTCQETRDTFLEVFALCKIEPSETIENYLNLMKQGLVNVTYNGNTVVADGNITYDITPFPIPYFNESVYTAYTTTTEFSNYLTQRLQSVGDNQTNLSGAESLMKYINYIYLNLEPLFISTSFNKVELGTEKQEYFFKDAYELAGQVNAILAQNKMKLQENASNPLVVLVSGNNLSNTVKFKLHKDYLASYLTLLDGIRVVIGSSGQGVYFSSEELRYIFESRDSLYFELDFSSTNVTHSVNITFFEADGKTEMPEIPSSIFFTLPTATTTSTIYSFIEGQNTENWGGVVKLNNTIEFATTFTGEYVVREANVKIDDIADLSLETQEKINFMVAQGFIQMTGNNFSPDEPFTRTELVSALVKMFFMQDTTATSNFNDLSSSNSDYAIISAAYQAGIATGYEDNTFRGSNLTTKEEIITFLARTLETRKGYKLTGDPEEIIQTFTNYETFPAWTVEYIALAIEHKLMDNTGTFDGSAEISRREAALLLYTLFLKLYDSSESSTQFYNVSEGIGFPIFIPILVIVLIILTVIASKIKNRIESEKRFKQRMERITSTIDEDIKYMNDDLDNS